MNEQTFSTEWLGRTLTIKTGKLAKQADAAVTVQYGETVVLATAVESKTEREGIDFFPLMVDLEERLYAAGIIKGSRWIKREGRPSDESILTGRMIDRSIRPLFDDSSRKDVQVVITILSVDQENDHDVISLVAASAVLAISGIKWRGPIGGIRIGQIDNKLIFNPTYAEQEKSDLDLIVAGTDKKAIMIEAGIKEIKEEVVLKATMAGLKEIKPVIDLIKKMQGKIKPKQSDEKKDKKSEDEIKAEAEREKVFADATAWLEKNAASFLFNKIYYTKGERKAAVKDIKENLNEYLFLQNINRDIRLTVINSLVDAYCEKEVSRSIFDEKRRVDGRKFDEIRELKAEVGILPRNHGAGLFSRGETQIMSIVTLGAPGLAQNLEGLEGTGTKRYMHHYNFPPYSVGETSPMRGPGRREIGHGALAEKALLPVMPEKEAFPYTIRVVSETLSSNGSSSMGSTCASSLALMDAGVPISKAVAGIAIGLASNEDLGKWQIITDLQDLEDGKGGMDFKITGTRDGLTAIQLDTKTDGLTEEILKETFARGRQALNEILDVMDKAIGEPRTELSKYAPRITSFKIDPEKIREVIGPGGKIINKIIDECEVEIDIEDDGLVMVCGTNVAMSEKAVNWIKDIVRVFKPGEIFKGKVTRLMDFGAFVELPGGHEGMAHVSELAPYRISRPENFVAIGDEVTVRVKEIDDMGRVNLTMKNLEKNEPLWKSRKGEGFGDQPERGFGNHGRSRFNSRPSRKRY